MEIQTYDTQYETEHYRLIRETALWDSPCKGYVVYKLVNIHNGQIEGEGISLGNAIFSLLQATEQLNEALAIYSAAPSAPVTEEIH